MKITQVPKLYCKRHQVFLKTEEERVERQEKTMEIANFARNLEYCQARLKKNQDNNLKHEIGTQAFN